MQRNSQQKIREMAEKVFAERNEAAFKNGDQILGIICKELGILINPNASNPKAYIENTAAINAAKEEIKLIENGTSALMKGNSTNKLYEKLASIISQINQLLDVLPEKSRYLSPNSVRLIKMLLNTIPQVSQSIEHNNKLEIKPEKNIQTPTITLKNYKDINENIKNVIDNKNNTIKLLEDIYKLIDCFERIKIKSLSEIPEDKIESLSAIEIMELQRTFPEVDLGANRYIYLSEILDHLVLQCANVEEKKRLLDTSYMLLSLSEEKKPIYPANSLDGITQYTRKMEEYLPLLKDSIAELKESKSDTKISIDNYYIFKVELAFINNDWDAYKHYIRKLVSSIDTDKISLAYINKKHLNSLDIFYRKSKNENSISDALEYLELKIDLLQLSLKSELYLKTLPRYQNEDNQNKIDLEISSLQKILSDTETEFENTLQQSQIESFKKLGELFSGIAEVREEQQIDSDKEVKSNSIFTRIIFNDMAFVSQFQRCLSQNYTSLPFELGNDCIVIKTDLASLQLNKIKRAIDHFNKNLLSTDKSKQESKAVTDEEKEVNLTQQINKKNSGKSSKKGKNKSTPKPTKDTADKNSPKPPKIISWGNNFPTYIKNDPNSEVKKLYDPFGRKYYAYLEPELGKYLHLNNPSALKKTDAALNRGLVLGKSRGRTGFIIHEPKNPLKSADNAETKPIQPSAKLKFSSEPYRLFGNRVATTSVTKKINNKVEKENTVTYGLISISQFKPDKTDKNPLDFGGNKPTNKK